MYVSSNRENDCAAIDFAPVPEAITKIAQRRTAQIKNVMPLSMPLPSFMTIYFKYFPFLNANLIYAQVCRCAAAKVAHLKNRWHNRAGANSQKTGATARGVSGHRRRRMGVSVSSKMSAARPPLVMATAHNMPLPTHHYT